MDPVTILTLLNGLINTAFNLYKMLKQIAGEKEIPTWNEILQKNGALQAEIDKVENEGI
jgi:hypothetical protein